MRADAWVPLLILVSVISLARTALVAAHRLPPVCARCALPLERRRLGQRICSCR